MNKKAASIVAAGILSFGISAAANAQTQSDDDYVTSSSTLPDEPTTRPDTPTTQPDNNDPSGDLPFTGGDVIGMTAVALGLAGAGTSAVVLSRRKRHS